MKNLEIIVKYHKLLLYTTYILLFLGCAQEEDVRLEKRSVNADGIIIYDFYYEGNRQYVFSVDSNGTLVGILNVISDSNFQVLRFHGNGALESKANAIDLNGELVNNGLEFTFYGSTGTRSGHSNYRNGLRVGGASTLFDTTNVMKQYMIFNDSGQLCYRETYNKYGFRIKTEGEE